MAVSHRATTIELFKEDQKFSAGHFTIFSSTERENMHGHNFQVAVSLTGVVDDNGMLFDYVGYKNRVRELCKSWNETFLLPGESPHLVVEEADGEVRALFNGEVIRFLPRDVTVLPVKNITLEELSMLFGQRLTDDEAQLRKDGVQAVEVKCASGPGQWASWRYVAPQQETGT